MWRKIKTINDVLTEFWLRVKKTDTCWIWEGPTNNKGYGCMSVFGKGILAHRFSYQTYVSSIPDGMFICHKCDITRCVNPDHLFLGTAKDNMADCVKKGRYKNVRGKVQRMPSV